MISAKQTKNILSHMFSTVSGFNAPTATFAVAPTTYDDLSVPAPGGVTFSGTITPNDAIAPVGAINGWSIMNGATTLASGTGNTVAHTLVTIPSVIGTYSYNLVVSYTDNLAQILSLIIPVTIIITGVGYYGQLALPGDTITIPADLTAPILATFTSTTQPTMINLFTVTAVNTGRVVLVIPYSWGTLSDISDNTNATVLSEFTLVDDPGNSREIYTTDLALVPGTYYYKVTF